MKKHLLLLAVALFVVNAYTQSPDLLSYQAVIRDAGNNLVKNTEIGLQISILQTSESGTAVYVETHSPTTNNNGLVTVEIGDGSVVSGTFASIDWSSGPYFIKTEIDPDGGTTYTVENTTQILSVPYALYSETAASLVNPPFSYLSGSGTSGVIHRSGDVALGNVTDPLYNGLYVQNYTTGKAAVLGTDQSGSSIYAEGMLGVLNGAANYLGLPVDVVNAGVLGIKPTLGNIGAAVYGWNNDNNAVNYGGVFVADGAGTTNYGIYVVADNGTNNYAGFFDGRIGINKLDPVSDIHLVQSDGTSAGPGGMSFERSGSRWKILHTGSHFSFALNGTRMAYVEAGTGDYVVTSDATLKTDIEEMGPVLDKVLQLKPVKYRFIRQDESANKTIGFLAQDVEKLFPGLSHQAEDGTLGLSYTDFGILSIQAIQEQQSQIEVLKAENAALRAEIEAIKVMLE